MTQAISNPERAVDPSDSSDVLAACAALAASARATGAGATGDVVILDVSEILAVCDWFVIASGSNPLQVKAIVEEIEFRVSEELDTKPIAIEGLENRRWVVMDYGDVVVHVFHQEDREFYRLERLFPEVDQLLWR